ncbi:FkbM family methyltransferase [Persicitalea sp.]|uniref:FkbM family methyltransferase n=1 Tax=Persicitalea sp. TaxID=3100273 RepID=UPI003593A2B9
MQKIYEALFRIALSGMNYGNGGDFKESGEMNVLKIVKERFKNELPITIFDVGGNVGNYSKNLSDIFNDKATIHSFEPSKKTFEIFLRTTNGITNIIPNNFGLSDSETDFVLYSNAEASGLASVYHRNLEHFGISMDKSETIKLSTIDNYCQKNNINRIHFLKLDIEGHELMALKGAHQMIADKKIDLIQFEFGGCNIDSRTYFQDFFYLLKDKYRIYRILKDGLVEISQYKETNEVFITINYLAERLD